jgi:hypothetical protein
MMVKLLAAGDHSSERLLHPFLSASAPFVKSTPTTFTPSDIVQIAGGKKLGVLCKNGALYVCGEDFENSTILFRRFSLPRTVYLALIIIMLRGI